jgi:hypothetical protein
MPATPPLCECGCGLPVKWDKNGKVWNRWRPGHSHRSQGWRQRRPEKAQARDNRDRDRGTQLSLLPDLVPAIVVTGDCEVDCLERCAHPGQFSECELGVL